VNLADIEARKRRLEELSRGMARELVLIEECQDPLLSLERKHYLGSLRDALGGIESARVVLARACQRRRASKPLPSCHLSARRGRLLLSQPPRAGRCPRRPARFVSRSRASRRRAVLARPRGCRAARPTATVTKATWG
jgi:hypothetical protein